MKRFPKVSVVIPTFNREKYIGECLVAALSLDYPDLEVIVIDNASTDRTVEVANEIARSDSRVQVAINDRNVGPVANWRRGAQMATGEYVKILFSDDLVESSFVRSALEIIEGDSSIGFVFSGVKLFGSESGQLYCDWQDAGSCSTAHFLSELVREGPVPFSPGCSFIRRLDFLEALQTGFPLCRHDDFAMHGAGPDVGVFVNLAFEYPCFGYLPQPLHAFRAHEGSITTNDMRSGVGKVKSRVRSAVLSLVIEKRGIVFGWLAANSYYANTPAEWRRGAKTFLGDLGIETRLPVNLVTGKIARAIFKYVPGIWNVVRSADRLQAGK